MKTTTLFTASAATILVGIAFLGAQSGDRATRAPESQVEKLPPVQPAIQASPTQPVLGPSSCTKPPRPANLDTVDSPVETSDEGIVIEIDGQEFIVDEHTLVSFTDPARCDFDFDFRTRRVDPDEPERSHL